MNGYKIVDGGYDVTSLREDVLNSRPESKKRDRAYLSNYLGDANFKVTSLDINMHKNLVLNYRHPVSGDNFNINLNLVYINCSWLYTVYHGHGKSARTSKNGVTPPYGFLSTETSATGILKKYIAFAITVGDILKYVRKTRSLEKDKALPNHTRDEKISELSSGGVTPVCEKLLQKSLKIDSQSKSKSAGSSLIKRIIGISIDSCGGGVDDLQHLRSRGFLPLNAFDRRGGRGSNFTSFCDKLVIFDSRESNKALESNESWNLYFQSFINETLCRKLLGYFLHGDSLVHGDSSNNHPSNYHHRLDKPTLLTDVLARFYEETKDERFEDARKRIMKKLSKAQEQELEERFPCGTFKTIDAVPRCYPTWAYRNISIREWTRDALDCGWPIVDNIRRTEKMKHLQSRSEKWIDEYRRSMIYPPSGCGCSKCFGFIKGKNRSGKKINIKDEINIKDSLDADVALFYED